MKIFRINGSGCKSLTRSRFSVSGALAGVVVLLVLFLLVSLYQTADSGRLQAQDPSNAQFCAGLITDATQVSLRSDCEVLLDIKETLQGPVAPGDTAPLNWGDTGVAFDAWTGVTLAGAGAQRRVSELDIPTVQLAGEIPEDLGQLTALTGLYLNDNQLTGSIPSSLGNLTALTILVLNENELTGSIPSSLGDLNSLGTLSLFSNRLTGSIPTELGDLSNLTRLYLHQNRLTGEIPSELGNLSNLEHLYLYSNELTGEIPSVLGDLSNLVWVYLHNNRLTGEIPSELGGITGLEVLYLYSNRLTGSIPPSFNNLSELEGLHIEDNQLTGALPDLNGLVKLKWLGLGTNDLDLDWSTFESGGNLVLDSSAPATRSLESLFLEDSGLEGPIPEWIASKHTGMKLLWLHDNELTGEVPANFGGLSSLTELYLHDNRLTGAVPDLNGLVLLTKLGLGGNDLDLDWSMFESGGNLVLDSSAPATRRLGYLILHDSGLEGSIPEWLAATHTGLKELWLHNNELTGVIPANLSNLAMLVKLRLGGNLLTGGWEALVGLTELDVLSLGLVADLFVGSGRSVPLVGKTLFLEVALPSDVDPTRSGVTVSTTSVDFDDVHVPPHSRIARTVRVFDDSARDIIIELRDGQGELVEGDLSVPAVVCLPVPSADASDDTRVLKSADGEVWEYLNTADPPSGYDPGAGNVAVCGMTDSFSVFVAAAVEIVPISAGASGIARILRVEPSIQTATLSAGDTVRLSFDIYGRQDILDNDLGEGREFEWDDDGAGGSIRKTDRANAILYTAPESPGKYTVIAAPPDSACLGGEGSADRCVAKFTIIVRRSSAVSEERPAPRNPVGEIPTVLVDAEGRQYEVFTPEEGGSFDGGDVTLSAEPGVVPDLEIVGVRADAAGAASNMGMTAHRYTLVGDRYEVRAIDATETSISSYVLNSSMEVCVPLPPEARRDISDVAIVAENPDGTQTVLSATVRITDAGIIACGRLSALPASIAVGTAGSPDAIPTPNPDPIESPDTGGRAPSQSGLLVLAIISIAVILAGAASASFRRNDRTHLV